MEKVEITTHRGGSDQFPENSLAAFLESWSQDAIPEMDLQRTSDGTLLICHDETLDRTVKNLPVHLQNKPITAIDYKEIQELTLQTNSPSFTPSIPLLEEVLQYLQKDPKKQIFIDNKSASFTKEIFPLIEYYKVEKQIWMTTLSTKETEEVRKISPTIHTQLWISGSPEETESLFSDALGNDTIDSILFILTPSRKPNAPFHLPEWYIKESILRCRKKKYALSIYYSNYTKPLVQELLSIGLRRFAIDSLQQFKPLLG